VKVDSFVCFRHLSFAFHPKSLALNSSFSSADIAQSLQVYLDGSLRYPLLTLRLPCTAKTDRMNLPASSPGDSNLLHAIKRLVRRYIV
jgi:hypothetical protein